MKILKALIVFLTMIYLGSCFDPPEFPIVPEIEYNRIEFVDAQTDSLILYIDFKDGDGDLGIDNQDLFYNSYPFNNLFFFQENNGKLDTLYTTIVTFQGNQYEVLDIPNPAQGKLVFPRTRKKPEYRTLLPAFNCADYEYQFERNLIIEHDDLAALDNKVQFTDTLRPTNAPVFYQIQDTLYTQVNPDHYNIEVDFYVDNGSGLTEFDWRRQFCTQSFDGRFPPLSEREGVALEGTLRYAMNSVGLTELFSVKPLQLEVQIKDLARHRSRRIKTDIFTLDQKKKR